MRLLRSSILTILALALGGGCVTETARLGLASAASPAEVAEVKRLGDVAFDQYLDTDRRLQLISQRLRIAGAPLCEGELNPVLGLALSGQREVPRIHQLAAERRFPDRRLRVTEVFEALPAAKAGVKPGDVILSIGGRAFDNGYRAYKASGDSDASRVTVGLERDGKPLTLELEKVLGCAYPAFLYLSDEVNAGAPTELGIALYSSALVRELDQDTSLAFVVGHEMSHNIINRLDAANPSSSRDHEARADYMGAYIVAAAGYAISNSDSAIFDVLTRGDPNEIGKGKRASHPMSSQRTLALKQTVAEIRGKQDRGETLRPEVR